MEVIKVMKSNGALSVRSANTSKLVDVEAEEGFCMIASSSY